MELHATGSGGRSSVGDRIDLFDLARFRHLEVPNERFCEVAVIGCMRPIDVVRLQGASHGIAPPGQGLMLK